MNYFWRFLTFARFFLDVLSFFEAYHQLGEEKMQIKKV